MNNALGIRAGRAYVEMFADASRLDRDLRDIESKFKRAGQNIRRSGRQMLQQSLIFTVPMAMLLKASADIESTMDRHRQVFRKNSDAMVEWAAAMSKAVGRSKFDIMDANSRFMTFFRGRQIEVETATKLAQKLTKMRIDFGAFYDIDETEVQERFISALSGSVEAVDRFGIDLHKAALRAKLRQKGIFKDWVDYNEIEKMVARMELMHQSMREVGAIGQARREIDQLANRWKYAKGQAYQLAGAIGDVLAPTAKDLLKWIGDNSEAAAKWIHNHHDLVLAIAKGTVAWGAAGAAAITFGAGLELTSRTIKMVSTPIHVATLGLNAFTTAARTAAIAASIPASIFGRKPVRTNWGDKLVKPVSAISKIQAAKRLGEMARNADKMVLAFEKSTPALVAESTFLKEIGINGAKANLSIVNLNRNFRRTGASFSATAGVTIGLSAIGDAAAIASSKFDAFAVSMNAAAISAERMAASVASISPVVARTAVVPVHKPRIATEKRKTKAAVDTEGESIIPLPLPRIKKPSRSLKRRKPFLTSMTEGLTETAHPMSEKDIAFNYSAPQEVVRAYPSSNRHQTSLDGAITPSESRDFAASSAGLPTLNRANDTSAPRGDIVAQGLHGPAVEQGERNVQGASSVGGPFGTMIAMSMYTSYGDDFDTYGDDFDTYENDFDMYEGDVDMSPSERFFGIIPSGRSEKKKKKKKKKRAEYNALAPQTDEDFQAEQAADEWLKANGGGIRKTRRQMEDELIAKLERELRENGQSVDEYDEGSNPTKIKGAKTTPMRYKHEYDPFNIIPDPDKCHIRRPDGTIIYIPSRDEQGKIIAGPPNGAGPVVPPTHTPLDASEGFQFIQDKPQTVVLDPQQPRQADNAIPENKKAGMIADIRAQRDSDNDIKYLSKFNRDTWDTLVSEEEISTTHDAARPKISIKNDNVPYPMTLTDEQARAYLEVHKKRYEHDRAASAKSKKSKQAFSDPRRERLIQELQYAIDHPESSVWMPGTEMNNGVPMRYVAPEISDDSAEFYPKQIKKKQLLAHLESLGKSDEDISQLMSRIGDGGSIKALRSENGRKILEQEGLIVRSGTSGMFRYARPRTLQKLEGPIQNEGIEFAESLPGESPEFADRTERESRERRMREITAIERKSRERESRERRMRELEAIESAPGKRKPVTSIALSNKKSIVERMQGYGASPLEFLYEDYPSVRSRLYDTGSVHGPTENVGALVPVGSELDRWKRALRAGVRDARSSVFNKSVAQDNARFRGLDHDILSDTRFTTEGGDKERNSSMDIRGEPASSEPFRPFIESYNTYDSKKRWDAVKQSSARKRSRRITFINANGPKSYANEPYDDRTLEKQVADEEYEQRLQESLRDPHTIIQRRKDGRRAINAVRRERGGAKLKRHGTFYEDNSPRAMWKKSNHEERLRRRQQLEVQTLFDQGMTGRDIMRANLLGVPLTNPHIPMEGVSFGDSREQRRLQKERAWKDKLIAQRKSRIANQSHIKRKAKARAAKYGSVVRAKRRLRPSLRNRAGVAVAGEWRSVAAAYTTTFRNTKKNVGSRMDELFKFIGMKFDRGIKRTRFAIRRTPDVLSGTIGKAASVTRGVKRGVVEKSLDGFDAFGDMLIRGIHNTGEVARHPIKRSVGGAKRIARGARIAGKKAKYGAKFTRVMGKKAFRKSGVRGGMRLFGSLSKHTMIGVAKGGIAAAKGGLGVVKVGANAFGTSLGIVQSGIGGMMGRMPGGNMIMKMLPYVKKMSIAGISGALVWNRYGKSIKKALGPMMPMIDAVCDNAKKLGGMVADGMGQLASDAKKYGPMIWDNITSGNWAEAAGQTWKLIKMEWNNGCVAIYDQFSGVIDTFTEYWDHGVAIFKNVWEDAKYYFNITMSWIEETGYNCWNKISMWMQDAWNFVKPAVMPVLDFLGDAWDAIVEGAKWMYDLVVDVFSGLGTWFKKVGQWIGLVDPDNEKLMNANLLAENKRKVAVDDAMSKVKADPTNQAAVEEAKKQIQAAFQKEAQEKDSAIHASSYGATKEQIDQWDRKEARNIRKMSMEQDIDREMRLIDRIANKAMNNSEIRTLEQIRRDNSAAVEMMRNEGAEGRKSLDADKEAFLAAQEEKNRKDLEVDEETYLNSEGDYHATPEVDYSMYDIKNDKNKKGKTTDDKTFDTKQIVYGRGASLVGAITVSKSDQLAEEGNKTLSGIYDEVKKANEKPVAPIVVPEKSSQEKPENTTENTPAPVEKDTKTEDTPAPVEKDTKTENTPAPVEKDVKTEDTPTPVEKDAKKVTKKEASEEKRRRDDIIRNEYEESRREANSKESIKNDREASRNAARESYRHDIQTAIESGDVEKIDELRKNEAKELKKREKDEFRRRRKDAYAKAKAERDKGLKDNEDWYNAGLTKSGEDGQKEKDGKKKRKKKPQTLAEQMYTSAFGGSLADAVYDKKIDNVKGKITGTVSDTIEGTLSGVRWMADKTAPITQTYQRGMATIAAKEKFRTETAPAMYAQFKERRRKEAEAKAEKERQEAEELQRKKEEEERTAFENDAIARERERLLKRNREEACSMGLLPRRLMHEAGGTFDKRYEQSGLLARDLDQFKRNNGFGEYRRTQQQIEEDAAKIRANQANRSKTPDYSNTSGISKTRYFRQDIPVVKKDFGPYHVKEGDISPPVFGPYVKPTTRGAALEPRDSRRAPSMQSSNIANGTSTAKWSGGASAAVDQSAVATQSAYTAEVQKLSAQTAQTNQLLSASVKTLQDIRDKKTEWR